MPRYLSALALWFILTPGCSSQKDEKSANISGLPYVSSLHIAVPCKLSTPKAAAIGQALAKAGQKSFATSMVTKRGNHPGRNVLKKGYLRAVSDVQGIPRTQGEEILRKVVSNDYGSCDGLSCAKVFGVDPMEVPQFFDETFFEVAASPNASKQENAAQRKALISSLAKEEVLADGEALSTQERVTRLFLNAPESLPNKAIPPSPKISHAQVEKKLGWDFIRALEGFTTTDFMPIRFVESFSDAELIRQGWASQHIKTWRQRSDTIQEGFDKLPSYRGFVYRGIAGLPPDQIAAWMEKMARQEPIGLGPFDHPALTSASWDPGVAKNFAGFTVWENLFPLKTYAVYMVIDQKRGLAIDEISIFKDEREVILPRDAKYRIESMVPIAGHRGKVLMKLREIPPLEQVKTLKKAS